jgi:hypothetical protein
MRKLTMTAVFTLFAATATAQIAEEKVSIGPWDIATSFRGNTFVHCEMRRTVDGLGITFLRAEDGLALLLDSTKWTLERGKSYVVKLSAGGAGIDGKAEAASKGVAIVLPDRSFNSRLRSADSLDVKGEGATLTIPLDGSMMALERLEACFAKNAKSSADINPFVAPSRKP